MPESNAPASANVVVHALLDGRTSFHTGSDVPKSRPQESPHDLQIET